MKRRAVFMVLVVLLIGAVLFYFKPPAAPGQAPAPAAAGEFTPEEIERILQHSPLGEPPRDPTNAAFEHPAAARLGQRIFFDPRFSREGAVSCSTCHLPERGFGDGEPLPKRFPVDRNVPTLWNVAYNRWFFWDGRVDTLWSQALKPLENPREHGGTRLQYVHLVCSDPVLRADYEQVFGPAPDLRDPARFPPRGGPLAPPAGGPLQSAWASMADADRVTADRVFANLGKAIAAYERRLVSRRSPFDVFAEGLKAGDPEKMKALSPEARKGLKIFLKGNCRLCHSGPAFTDGEFHNLGIPPLRGGLTPDRFAAIDEVRNDPFNGLGAFSDDRAAGAGKIETLVRQPHQWGQIKTPGLRNVARTAPYMHQGQFGSLEEVVSFYSTLKGALQAGHHERAILTPLLLNQPDTAALVAFLESLTDEAVDPKLLKPLE